MLLSDGLYQSTGFIYLWSRTGHTPASSLSHGFPHFSRIHGVCVAWAASSFDFISWHFCWIPKVIHSTKQSITNRFDVRGFWKFIVLVVKELQLLCVTVCSDVCDQQRAAQHQSERSSHMTWRSEVEVRRKFFYPLGQKQEIWDFDGGHICTPDPAFNTHHENTPVSSRELQRHERLCGPAYGWLCIQRAGFTLTCFWFGFKSKNYVGERAHFQSVALTSLC